MKSDYIYGRRTVIEALLSDKKPEKVFVAFGTEGETIEKIRTISDQNGVACSVMDKAKFAALERSLGLEKSGAQGVIAQRVLIEILGVHELIERTMESDDSPVVVYPDHVQDPHNLGAIVRSAECAGAKGVLVSAQGGSPITPSAMKVAAGAFDHIHVARTDAPVAALKDLKAAGFRLIGLDEKAQTDVYDADFHGPIVLVVGSEGKGLSPNIKPLLSQTVKIPMFGEIGSLNASVSAGVFLFEVVRQRRSVALNEPSSD